jgi:phosphoribosyl 1,2-cyclic phosphodiesterase
MCVTPLNSHFSLEHAIGMLEANDLSKLEEIHLIHLSSNNANA